MCKKKNKTEKKKPVGNDYACIISNKVYQWTSFMLLPYGMTIYSIVLDFFSANKMGDSLDEMQRMGVCHWSLRKKLNTKLRDDKLSTRTTIISLMVMKTVQRT